MFVILGVLINSLLVHNTVTSNDAYFENGWVPVTGPFVFNQMRKSHDDITHASGWKPTIVHEDNNIDDIKEDGITIIDPVQVHAILKGNKDLPILQIRTEEVSKGTESNNILSKNAVDELHKNQENLLKTNAERDEKKKIQYFSVLHRRTPKQAFLYPSFTENPSSKLLKEEQNMKTIGNDDVQVIIKNLTENNYEVTEPSHLDELRQETSVVHNEYTNNFINFLSKHGINGWDTLNNYDISKRRQSKKFDLYPSQVSPAPLIPFRYNSLNHLPPDPLLAVFLSNYGYYLKGFYGQPNNYKNLYGYSASNNIHNNKPFGSYKIYSDTDSSN